jgi:large conductance mechanosensitive channel
VGLPARRGKGGSAVLKEFKDFVLRGNVLELAVAVILGIAFNAVVQSLVNDVLINLIAAIVGKPDFTALTFEVGKGVIRYGSFLTVLINFLIVAFVVFLVVKAFNRMSRRGETAAPTTKACPYCLTEIPIEATRCPACTSQLSPAQEARATP